jgi:adenylate cyclase
LQQELERVLASRVFADSPRLQEFLRFVVDESIEGRAGRIKGYTIAQAVYQRDDSEDPQASTVVRVEAARLRRHLDEYYAEEGKDNPLRIVVAKGGYVPKFELNERRSPGVATASHSTGSTNKRRWLSGLFAAFAVTGVAVAFLFRLDVSIERFINTDEAVTASLSSPAIAVLPFGDLTTDGSGRAVAAGLTEDIITDLGRLSGVDVIALSSVLPFSDSEASPAEVDQALAVSHILRGTIRGTRAKLRATAQLYEVATNRQIWASRFDRSLGDELTLENELALKVVDSLSIRLQPREQQWLSSRLNMDREAYSLYKQAMNLGNPPTNPARLKVAMRAFEGVIEMNPEFAGGYAGNAYMHAFYAYFGHSQTPGQDIDAAIALAGEALQRDSDFGLAHTALAFAYLARRDFDEAIAASWKAVELQPNDPYVSAYHGVLLCFNGDAEEGIPYAKRALRLDPLSSRTPYLNILGTVLFQAGDYEGALGAKIRSIERGGPESPGNQAYRAALYALVGRQDEARETFKLYEAYKGKFDFEAWLRRSFRHEADVENVMRPLRELGAE